MNNNIIKTNNVKLSINIFYNIYNKYCKNDNFKLFKYNFFNNENTFYIKLIENDKKETYSFKFNNKKNYEKFIKEINKIII